MSNTANTPPEDQTSNELSKSIQQTTPSTSPAVLLAASMLSATLLSGCEMNSNNMAMGADAFE